MSKGSMFESYLHNENGVIAWRRGTGDNVEITYIRVDEKRKGSGKNLLIGMIKELEWNPPYHTIFGFTRVSNHDARNFYKSMGFVLTEVTGVYADGKAILFSAPFTYLQELHLGNPYVSMQKVKYSSQSTNPLYIIYTDDAAIQSHTSITLVNKLP